MTITNAAFMCRDCLGLTKASVNLAMNIANIIIV